MVDPTPAEVIAFLNGEGPLDDTWFGDPLLTDPPGRFWWRKYLPLLTPPSMRRRCAHIARGWKGRVLRSSRRSAGPVNEECEHGVVSDYDCIACYDSVLATKIAAIRKLGS